MTVTVFSPAKLNLYLAVTGRRPDGFHDLVSLAAPLDFGDELTASLRDDAGTSPGDTTTPPFRLECDCADVPLDESNLIVKAGHAYVAATGWPGQAADGRRRGVDFKLVKRIPMGAGLGGGSSNAVAALRALNTLSGGLLGETAMAKIAAKLGSDCVLFLHGAPVIMRGRGEQIETLSASAAKRLRGQRVLLFKPGFGISTPWAYGRMAAEAPVYYLPASQAEQKLAAWLETSPAFSVGDLLFNNMEGVAFAKFIALPVLLAKLRTEFGVEARMSGSGSACFAVIGEAVNAPAGAPGGNATAEPATDLVARMKALIRASWGEMVFVQEARLL